MKSDTQRAVWSRLAERAGEPVADFSLRAWYQNRDEMPVEIVLHQDKLKARLTEQHLELLRGLDEAELKSRLNPKRYRRWLSGLDELQATLPGELVALNVLASKVLVPVVYPTRATLSVNVYRAFKLRLDDLRDLLTEEELEQAEEVLQLNDLPDVLFGEEEAPEDAPTLSGRDVETALAPGVTVWLFSPGRQARRWPEFQEKGIAAIGWDYLGDLNAFDSSEAIFKAMREHEGEDRNPYQSALCCWQFCHEMKPGDLVFAKKGRSRIVGYGVVSGDYAWQPERPEFKHVLEIDWRWSGEVQPRDQSLVTKTLTEVTSYPRLVAQLMSAVGLVVEEEAPIVEEEAPSPETFTLEDALETLFLDRDELEEMLELLRYRKNLVLQGPPGTGKTLVVATLASLLVGERSDANMTRVQFHQSYGYEDFVQGYRPTEDGGFELKNGPFMRFCDQALQDQGTPYVLLIDEINRGNLSKIFGELLMLIEGDKRSPRWAVELAYDESGERFHVPDNVYIIGTMNTADRSLALVDYALRRRFVFCDLWPAFARPRFRAWLTQRLDAALVDVIVKRMGDLNARIESAPELGRHFQIGHSYFCSVPDGVAPETWYARVIRTEIQPLLREYWLEQDQADDAAALLLQDIAP